MTIRAAFFFCILTTPPLAAQQLWTPEHFWKQESTYAGSRSCLSCHGEIYKAQEASHHARSLRHPVDVAEITSRLPFELFDRVSGAKLLLQRKSENEIELVVRKEEAEDRITFGWAFGSGSQGITPMGRRSNGEFAESRISWYRSLDGFDLTTGAGKHNPQTATESLGRTLPEEEIQKCFGCHTTGSAAGQPGLAGNEMGVRCERCHGPGLEHIRAMQSANTTDKKIFHPASLDGFGQAQTCGVCHGRPPMDTEFQTIRFIQETPNSIRFPSQRLVLSRCFNESEDGLRCTSCHDPHTNASEHRAASERTCLGCHQKGAQGLANLCPVAKSGCASCHMSKERVMAHSVFTDHWIRVVRTKR